jgi:hypothetical protein
MSARLKIRVSVVRFRDWPPEYSSKKPSLQAGLFALLVLFCPASPNGDRLCSTAAIVNVLRSHAPARSKAKTRRFTQLA